MEKGNRLYKLRSHGFVEINDGIWFANLSFNALMKINKISGQIEVIDKFPNYDIWVGWLYGTVCYVNEKLVCIPTCSQEIVVYDLHEKKFVSVALDIERMGGKKDYFLNAYLYGQYVYMFPVRARCIVRYDVINNSIKYLENCLSVVATALSEDSLCFYQQFEVVEEKIYIPFVETNAVAIFNPKNENINIQYLNIIGGCSTINYVGGYFYMASWKYPFIYRWDIKNGEIKIYDIILKEFEIGKQMFFCACSINNRIFFFPEQSNMIISFDTKSEKIYGEQIVENFDNECFNTYFVKKKRGINYTLLSNKESICTIDYKNKTMILGEYYQLDGLYNKKKISKYLLDSRYYDAYFEQEKTMEEYIDVLLNTEEKCVVKNQKYNGKMMFDLLKRD